MSPLQWSAGELNPDFLVAGQASSRWTSTPLTSEAYLGIEPNLRPYRGRVLPEHLCGRADAGEALRHEGAAEACSRASGAL